MNHAQFWGGGGAAPYQIEQSLRFDGSSNYLSRTPSSNTSTNKKGTFSCWMKVSSNSGTNGGTFIGAADSYHYAQFYDERFYFGNDSSYLGTAGRRRDYSAWYHVLYVFDTTLATTDDRTKIYVNGSRLASETFNTQPSQDSSFKFLNTTQVYNIGRRPTGNYWHGYMAECHFVDGTALDHEDFGELDESGVWRPIAYTGSYGTNGFYLKFDPSAANGVGHDHSGNGNHFTASGFTTSGTGTDVMSDTPTNNYCTLDPINVNNNTSALSPSNGNLDLTAHFGRFGTIAVTSGKWYWEVTLTGTNSEYNYYFGAQNVQKGTVEARMMCNGGNTPDGNNISGNSNGTKTQPTGSRPSLPATIGVKLDMDNGDIEFVQGGVVNGKVTGITNWNGAVAPYISANTTTFNYKTATLNFGQRAFSNTIPTGYSALSTAALPAPDIADGSDYFNTVTYSGNSSTQSITGVGFQPDLLWIKRRNASYSHQLLDAVRGKIGSDSSYARLASNLTNVEATPAGDDGVQSLDTDGFTTLADESYNETGGTYVAWNWLAANGTETNTAGSRTSTVSVNPTAGFSIVNFTGTGSALTVGHGLGVAPDLMIAKNRDKSDNWVVWHNTFDMDNYVFLEAPYAKATTTNPLTFWNNTAPTSTVVSVGANSNTNVSGNDTILYCFAEVEGYSKFGSYSSNNSADGPFVFCGFKPELVWLKKTSGSSNWFMYDAARNEFNVMGNKLYADSNAGENGEDGGSTTSNTIDILSNGFKLRTNNGTNNGGDYIFCAWAQHPFGGSGVSPATAR